MGILKKQYCVLTALFVLTLVACTDSSSVITDNGTLATTSITSDTTVQADEEIPKNSFLSLKVQGLSPKDAAAFGNTMASYGWKPVVTCMGNYCDIATKEHLDKRATIILLSGHGYVIGSEGEFSYSDISESYHKNIVRTNDKTDYYTYRGDGIWTETGGYSDMVEYHQEKGTTDWFVFMACNQLNLYTRESIIAAMKTPSDSPIKGVLSYGGLSGGYLDELIATKFVDLCMNNDGQGKVAYAWLAANQTCAPLLAPRARIALRQDFQYDSLMDEPATAEHALNDIRFWKLEGKSTLLEYPDHNAQTIAAEITFNIVEGSTISFMDVGSAEQNDLEQSRQQAIKAAEQDERVPSDFRLYRSDSIIEMDYDGSNEQLVARLHTFARYINDIRVSINPQYGEYLNLILDNSQYAEMDMTALSSSEINLDDHNLVKMIPTAQILSEDAAAEKGLEAIKDIQENVRGFYYYESQLKSAELIYATSPSDPNKLVLAWEIFDDNLAFVIIAAQDGSAMYWSE